MRMKRSGRTSIIVIITVTLVAAVIGLFLLAGESPTGVGTKFLTALANGNEKQLAELSHMDGLTQAQIEEKWKGTYETSKYWLFAYRVLGTTKQDANTATIRLDWIKNAANPGSYEEKFELPMVLIDGKWKVDVRAISREMYPGLPR